MKSLKELLSEEKVLESNLVCKHMYYEDIYHIDDLKHPELHDKVLSFGNKIFSFNINFTRKTFISKRLCGDTIEGNVTEEDLQAISSLVNKYMLG